MDRRRFLAGAGVAGLAALSGCLGVVGMDEHEATPAGVNGDTREETGYEQTEIEEMGIEEEFEAGPISESISVANYLTEHEKSVDLSVLGSQRAAAFMILATPQISVPGAQFNPVEDMSPEDLADLVSENYDEMGSIDHEDDYSLEILGETTNVAKFDASARFEGEDIDVDLHVSEAVETDDDLLVTIGVYPQEVRVEEEGNVAALMEGVVETADESESQDGDGDENGDDTGNGEEENGGVEEEENGGDEEESSDGENDDDLI